MSFLPTDKVADNHNILFPKAVELEKALIYAK